MKLFNKIFLTLSLFLVGSFSQNSFGMGKKVEAKEDTDEMGKIIFITGISSSGKSTIAKAVCGELTEIYKDKIKYVAQDEFDENAFKEEESKKIEQSSRLEADQRLAIEKAKKLALEGYIVICDIVPLNSLSELILNDILDQTRYYPTYTILIHTPLKQIIQQAKRRTNLTKQAKADEDDDKRLLKDPLEQFARSYKDGDKTGAKSPKNIPERLSSPELEKQCAEFTPPNSPLGNRLFYAFEANLLPGKKQEVSYITPIQSFDYIFQNNKFDPKTGKPSPASIEILVFAIKLWLKTATTEWEKALDADQKSDDDGDELTEVNTQSSSSSSSQQKQKVVEKKDDAKPSDDDIFDDYEDAKLADYSDDEIFDDSDDKADEKVSSSNSSSQQKQKVDEKPTTQDKLHKLHKTN